MRRAPAGAMRQIHEALHSPTSGPDPVPKLTLKQLSYFAAAAHHQSVLKAAQDLRVSPPSISAAIAHLESVLGMQLFLRRHARGLVLTQAGRDLAVEARSILGHVRELESARSLGSGRLQGRIELGCLVSFAPYLIPPLLQSFASTHPGVRIRWQEGDHEALIAALAEGALDVAFLYDFEVPSAVHCTALRTMPLQAVLPAWHPLARRRQINLADLADEPFILLDLPRTRDYFLSAFAEVGVEPRIVHRVQSYDMARSLVAHGFGYALLNFCPPYSHPNGAAIVSRRLGGKLRAPNLIFARLYRFRPTRAIEEFLGVAKKYIARLSVEATADRDRKATKR